MSNEIKMSDKYEKMWNELKNDFKSNDAAIYRKLFEVMEIKEFKYDLFEISGVKENETSTS